MGHDAILTFVLMAILPAIFLVVVYYEKKAKGTARSRKNLSLYAGIVAALVFVGATAFGLKITFLIISFAVLFVLLAIGLDPFKGVLFALLRYASLTCPTLPRHPHHTPFSLIISSFHEYFYYFLKNTNYFI